MRDKVPGQLPRLVGSLLALCAGVLALLLLGGGAAGAASAPSVINAPAGAGGSFRLTIDPPLSRDVAQANPDSPKTAVTVTIQALDARGTPLRNAIVDFTLTAPKFGSLFGSDVPRAEGLKLLHTRSATADGRYRFTYVLPIRGRYQVDLRASPIAGAARFAPLAAHPTFVLPERGGELLHLIVFLVGLFAFGLLSAIVLTRAQLRVAARRAASGGGPRPGGGGGGPPRPRARVSVSTLTGAALVLLVLGFAAYLVVNQIDSLSDDDEVGRLQGPGAGIDHAAATRAVELRYHLNRSPRDRLNVRALLENRGRLVDRRTGRPVRGATFQLTAIDDESGKPAFTATTVSRDGTYAWDQVFWDGVGYKLTVAAAPAPGGPAFAPVRSSSAIDVEALSPPLLRKIAAQLLLLAAVVSGMIGGVVITKRRARRPARSAERAGSAAVAPVRQGG